MLVTISVLLLLLIFFLSGINKIMNFKNTVNGFKKVFFLKKMPDFIYNIIIGLVVLLEILAPLVIVYNLQTNNLHKMSYYSVLSLIMFTIMATLLYHYPTKKGQYYTFLKNLSITGGLLLLLSTM